jgi:hypothetical protein
VNLDPRTGQHAILADRRRWLVRIHGMELRLVETEEDLRSLVHQLNVGNETQVYEVGSGPRALGDVPELARILLETPPPDRIVHEDLGPRARAKLSQELQILDRPLEVEAEYYDELPASRWPGRLAFLAGLTLILTVGYLLLAPRLPALAPRVLAARVLSAARSLGSSVPTPTPAPAVPAATVTLPPPPLPLLLRRASNQAHARRPCGDLQNTTCGNARPGTLSRPVESSPVTTSRLGRARRELLDRAIRGQSDG